MVVVVEQDHDSRMVDNGESLIDIDLSDTEWQISSDLPAIFRLLD